MKKENVINKLKKNCGLYESSSASEGVAEKNFNIHRKNKGSFKVKKGATLVWGSNKNLTIIQTKSSSVEYDSLSAEKSFTDNVLTFLGNAAKAYGENEKRKKERENNNRYKIFWNQIEGVGG